MRYVDLFAGAYYFRGVDSEYRRAYGEKTTEIEQEIEEIISELLIQALLIYHI